VLDVAMRVQKFQRRNLRLQGSWLWLLGEFASCYGVSESYTKLRYVMGLLLFALKLLVYFQFSRQYWYPN
jgi:hypothetical protein